MLFFPFLEPVPGHFVFIKDQVQPPLEKNLKQAYYKVFVTAKLLKYVKISTPTASDSLLQKWDCQATFLPNFLIKVFLYTEGF